MVKLILTIFSFPPNRLFHMLGRTASLAMAFALLGGAFVMSAPAPAQCRLCDTPDTQRSEDPRAIPLQLELQTRLDFDQLVLIDANRSGAARLNPDGSSTTSGSIGAITGRAMVGSVAIRGEPGRQVRVVLPRVIILFGSQGGKITLDDVSSDLGPDPKLDAQGNLQFRFGGELKIDGEVDGDFRGDLPITVDYL